MKNRWHHCRYHVVGSGLDVQNAYPEDHQLLGLKWRGAFYVDMVLPFGIRSAPYIFTSLAELVEWTATQNYDVTFLMHYLNDFDTLGPPSSPVCQHNLNRSINSFSKLSIPLHLDKSEVLSTCMTILGIELNSDNLQAQLPKDKFDRITAILEVWSYKCFRKQKDLESLIGHLQHACKVVPQGQSFLHQMINLLCPFYHHSPQPGVLSRPKLVDRVLQILEWLQFPSVSTMSPSARLPCLIWCLWSIRLWSYVLESLVLRLVASKTGLHQSIKRTIIELENNGLTAFLYTLVSRRNGVAIIDVYQKPTHTDRYLDFSSHHAIKH